MTKPYAAFLGLALIAGCSPTTVQAGPASAQVSARTPRDAADAADRDVIAQLKNNGSDVTKPVDVVYYLYIPSFTDAIELARRSSVAGYRTSIEAPLGKLPNGTEEKRYSVVAHKRMIPSLANARRARAFFQPLAHRFHGEYDGWEAAVTR